MLPEWVKKNDENLEFTGNSELDQIIKVCSNHIIYKELRFIIIQHKHFSKNLHFTENLQDLKSYFKIAFIKSFKNFTLMKDILKR